jgi:hypothetical protein
MQIDLSPVRRRRGRTYVAVVVYLLGFAVLLWVVWNWYLRAALDAAQHADPKGKFLLKAVSELILAVVLTCLLGGLILVFRVGRFFVPRPGPGPKRTSTKYIDAWSEAGKRLEQKKDEE